MREPCVVCKEMKQVPKGIKIPESGYVCGPCRRMIQISLANFDADRDRAEAMKNKSN